jgi:uncharacterized protein (DUF4415 family)
MRPNRIDPGVNRTRCDRFGFYPRPRLRPNSSIVVAAVARHPPNHFVLLSKDSACIRGGVHTRSGIIYRHLCLRPLLIAGAWLSIIGWKLNGRIRMTRPPNRYRPTDALSVAEAVFKPATPPAAEPVRAQRKGGVLISKELVSIKLDSDIIAHFQEDGPGWQERINDALRRATGL